MLSSDLLPSTAEPATAAHASWLVVLRPRVGGPAAFDGTTRRWSSPAGTRELAAIDPDGVLDCADRDGWVVCFEGSLFEPAILAKELGAPDRASAADLAARALARWGQDALLRLKGTWGLAAWDRADDRFLIARDPVGVQSAFFSETADGIALSPDVAALFRLPSVSRRISRAVLADHLSHRWLQPHETHYSDVSRVPAGCVFSWRAGRRSLDRYWYPVDPSGHIEWVSEDELQEFHVHFDRAIDRSFGRGPTGIFLSGGFDSVSIAAAAVDRAARLGTPRPLAASLIFPDPSCNEEPVQRVVAERLGMRQIFLGLEEALGPRGLIQAGVDLNRQSALPMMNAWRPAYLALGAAAQREGCDVVISGDGGDEWLTVGPEYIADLLRGLKVREVYDTLAVALRSFDTSRPLLVYNMLWRYGLRLVLASWGRRALRVTAPGLLTRRRLRNLETRSPAWVTPEPELQRELKARMERWTEESLEAPEPRGEYGFYLAGPPVPFLHPLRSMEMEEFFLTRASGLEERQPFWDPDLIQFLCRIHPRTLERGGRTKGLVREQIGQRFPEVGFERHRKVSASSFFSKSVAAEAPAVWGRLGGVKTLSKLGIVDAGKAEEAARADVGRIARSGNCRVWEMLNLEAWAAAHA